MIVNALSKYKRYYTFLSLRNLSHFQLLPDRQDLSSDSCSCSSAHRKMIGMRRGLWGVSRQNTIFSRETSFPYGGLIHNTYSATVSSTSEFTDQMPASAEETDYSPSPKRARIDEDMPNNTAVVPPVLRYAKLSENATPPKKGTEFAAGYDLYSAEDVTIPSHGTKTVMTDIKIELPEGCYGRVAPRSGLARNNQIDVGAGVIDRDYRGNVGVVMFNLSKTDFKVEKGMRIAQLICERIFYPEIEEVEEEELTKTERGSSGYGSTGTK
ncbi:deoxyuridine 5'-triphosphate nucleotidohydrolase-like isoform X2 [Acanthaster planci]|uniref:Deoxyuridine 5'-triphosphate nucleotidohydrolase n=1 Tax=Acanthaster planci TaxID=133434 RepID=A0A8B7XMC3_ACAPL|nr:deoxyuridine 5'-triphosphate nucleotidohydrolase-like isoform X2 [Acanthaster planci]